MTGKSDAGIVWVMGDEFEPGKLYVQHPQYRALILRKNSNDLSDWLDRAAFMYKSYGAEVVGNPPVVKWPSGALFRTGHLKNRDSYEKFLGHEYQRILIEELTQIAQEQYYIQIMGSCRSSLPELRPQIFCTTNPGSYGHVWVRDRFVTPSPYDTPFEYSEMIGGREIMRSRIYVPSSIDDNPTLVENDPGYLLYLEKIKEVDPDLYEAWRHGNWDVFAGQYFKEFSRTTHVISPQTPNKKFTRIAGIDWGYSASFVFLSSVVLKIEHTNENGDTFSFNRVITYREIDGTEKTPEQWAQIILEREKLDNYLYIRCDPAMFNPSQDGSDSIARQLKAALGDFGYLVRPASNTRIPGWAVMRKWLSIAPDGLPYWMITENCNNLINTIPTMIHDEKNVEDLDTTGEDHWCFCRHTQVLTKDGNKEIIDVKKGDYVWTPVGWSKVLELQKNGKQKVVPFLSTSATGNHPVLTKDGFLPLKHLKETDKMCNAVISKEHHIDGIQIQQDLPIRNILDVALRTVEANSYIEKYSNTIKGRLKKVWNYTIKMKILVITILKILRWSVAKNIIISIRKHISLLQEKTLNLLKKLPLNGISRKMVKSFTNGSEKSHGRTRKSISRFVTHVMKSTKHTTKNNQGSAAETVRHQCSGSVEVYNLKTDTGMFTANNVTVSNCDSARYMLKHIRFIDAYDENDHGTINKDKYTKFGLIDPKDMEVDRDLSKDWKTL